MKWKLISTPLGLSQPYGVSFKSQSAGSSGSSGYGGAAAASVFDNFIGGMFGMAVNDMNNAMNHRIAEETNQANKEINEQQIAYAREQYEKEKAENRYLVDQAYQRSSPAAQKARYIAAGINPYLAMSGSGGSPGSAGVSVGSPARGSQPSAIPMQTGAPMQAFNPFSDGFGISEAMGLSLAQKEQNLKERAFEHDLSVSENKQEMDWFDYLDRHAKNSADIRAINEQIDHMRKAFALEKDRYQLSADWQNFQQFVQKYQLEQRDREIAINKQLAASNIALNGTTISHLNQLISESKQKVFEMAQNGASQREIEGYVARQQKAGAEMIELDSERKKRQNDGSARQAYTDFTNWLLDPLKGIIGASASYSSGYSVSRRE